MHSSIASAIIKNKDSQASVTRETDLRLKEKLTIVKAIGGTLLFVPVVVWDAFKRF